MSSIEDIFSEPNMLDYARACIDLAVNVPDKQKEIGFDALVIPSRGALPFFLGMLYSLQDVSLISENHQVFRENLGVQKALAPLLPEDAGVSENPKGRKIKVLLAPFTADLNMERFAPEANSTKYTEDTRNYWAEVTAAFFKEPRERAKDPYFKSFVDIILRGIEGRNNIAQEYEEFPRINNFSMIDTVVSGKAATDILKAFDRLALKRKNSALRPTAFLVIDQNGERLKQNYKAYLNLRKINGEIEIFPIRRILSEDEGASLLGVSAVVYPSVMCASRKLEIDDTDQNRKTIKKEFFVGAGSWYLAPDICDKDKVYERNFNTFMDLVYHAIDAKFALDYQGIDSPDELHEFRERHKEFLKYAQKHKILSAHEKDTSAVKLTSTYTPKEPYETHAHVLHIPFTPETTQRAIIDLAAISGISLKNKKTEQC